MKKVLKKVFVSIGIISIMFVAVWAAFSFPSSEYFWLLSIASIPLVLGYLYRPSPVKR